MAEETPKKNETVMEMKARRDQLTMLVGQRTFNQEVLKAENIRDTQEILNLCNKIQEVESRYKPDLQSVPDAVKDAIETQAQVVEPSATNLVPEPKGV